MWECQNEQKKFPIRLQRPRTSEQSASREVFKPAQVWPRGNLGLNPQLQPRLQSVFLYYPQPFLPSPIHRRHPGLAEQPRSSRPFWCSRQLSGTCDTKILARDRIWVGRPQFHHPGEKDQELGEKKKNRELGKVTNENNIHFHHPPRDGNTATNSYMRLQGAPQIPKARPNYSHYTDAGAEAQSLSCKVNPLRTKIKAPRDTPARTSRSSPSDYWPFPKDRSCPQEAGLPWASACCPQYLILFQLCL